MRMHSLTVTAFGPFADTQTVDFDALGAAGLFLFSGPTGAGKTSILDAVCFALYGHVPGARDQARSLHSDHAPSTRLPQVVLEATLRGRRVRVTRMPQWDRPKQRGDGTTTEPAKVQLEERLGTEWRTLSTRSDETGHQLGRLLGLTREQFCQVVLLPQGQFAEFLRADAERRRDLLESLFDTGRFAVVERWLVARRQVSARAVEGIDQQVAQVLARIAEATGLDVPDDLGPARAPDWVAALLEHARTEQATARSGEALAVDRHEAAVAAVEVATVVTEAYTRRAALRSRVTVLTAASPVHEAAAREVEAARSVAPLLPLVAEVARLQIELEEARATASTAGLQLITSLPATGTDGAAALGLPLPPPRALQDAARDHRGEVGGLRTLAKDEDEAVRLAAATDSSQQRVVELDSQAHRLAAELAAAPARRTELAAARDHSHAAAAGLPGAEAAAGVAEGRLIGAEQRDDLVLRRVAAADHLRICTDAAQAARDHWLGLRQARLDGMAAELAGSLRDGADCPVCGSAEHPCPATARPDAVSREQEDAAAARLEALDRERADANDDVAGIDAARAAARAAAGGNTPVTDLRSLRDLAVDEVERLAGLAARADQDAAALTAFGEQHEEWLRQRVSLDQDAKNLRAQVAGDRERLRRLRATLDEARGDDPSIAARAARLARLAEDLERLALQVGTVEQLGDQVAEALQRAERAALERGFASVEDVAAMARDDDVVIRLDGARSRHDAELASVRQQLAEPSLSGLTDSPAPDLQALREQARDLHIARAEAAASVASASSRVDALLRLGVVLRGALAERAPLAEHHHTVDHLSRLAEGKSTDNRLRMSLSAYVLTARLEQVADAASERLHRMSGSRYSLLHTAIAGSARGRGGLHLRVLDAWTGAERDPATLSGGEAFSASLALALGLADVVTAEAGGSLLETLFVDEGFGSLDDETLDEVMGVLDGLRDGGRVVGIVSHVADLRHRIPAQVRVDKGRNGSQITQ